MGDAHVAVHRGESNLEGAFAARGMLLAVGGSSLSAHGGGGFLFFLYIPSAEAIIHSDRSRGVGPSAASRCWLRRNSWLDPSAPPPPLLAAGFFSHPPLS